MGNGPVLAALLRPTMKHDSLKILTFVGVFIWNNYTQFEHAGLILKWAYMVFIHYCLNWRCTKIRQENRNLFWVNPDIKDVYG